MKRLKLLIKQLASFFPTQIPVGKTKYDAWVESIIELAGNVADKPSMKYAISGMVLHGLGPQRNSVPKNYFVKSLKKTASNQIAYEIMKEMDAKKAEERQKLKEAADTATKVADGQQKENQQ